MSGFSINAKITGARMTGQKLRAMERNLPFELQKAIVETVRQVEKYAKRRAPVKTGETRARIGGDVLSPTSGVVGTDQAAAMAIDQGAKPHLIKPKNAKALAIPQKDAKGRYISVTRTRKLRSGRQKAGKSRKVQYKGAPNAPNKRHLDVLFYYAGRAHHPGKKPQPFLTSAAMIANRVASKESDKAVERAYRKAGGR